MTDSISYTKTSPCLVTISEKVLLNKTDSIKQTYHIGLNIADTSLHFMPGDSVGILPQNDPHLTQKLLSLLHIDPEASLLDPRAKTPTTVFDFFLHKVNFSQLNSSLLRSILPSLERAKDRDFLSHLLKPENRSLLLEFLTGKDAIDLLEELPITSFSSFEHLAPLLPRFYSISSSIKTHAKEVHLLVALSSYQHQKGIRYGVSSHFLCNLAVPQSTKIALYVQASRHFRLPENLDADIIMVGPGTGVAPYRAFLQERIHLGAKGRNWLFFGGRNQANDFFYQDFFLSLTKQGLLKLSTAFSRDQLEKEYVQHKLLENGAEVWKWLQDGAYFYVCGDASKMAKDVETALLFIIQRWGNLSEEGAKAFYKDLKSTKRYLTDVY
jgi:sulfite reductase (NADPH) flavoprotein alpha-component